MKRDDTLWKSILEDIFEDFLLFFYPDAGSFFDFSRKYDKPITAFAIFTENNIAFKPCEYHREFLGTSVLHQFNSYKILEQDEQMLRESDNPFAIVVLTALIALKRKHISESELLNLKIELTRNLINSNLPKSKINRLLVFLRCYIRFDNREIDIKFENKLIQIRQTPKTMGILELMKEELEKDGFMEIVDQILDMREAMGPEEFAKHLSRIDGITEGENNKATELVNNLLRETAFTVETIAHLTGVSLDFVEHLKRSQSNQLPN